ncbi:PIN domain-containing protein [Candidatus Thiodictyon syntrophicum]|nr:PIN domain-containing protein [Candidatus Thiodictyon syntrophicum]
MALLDIVCNMTLMRVVLDTNVLVAASRSRNGASFALLQALRERRYVAVASVPLMLEYEAVLKQFFVTAIAEKVSALKTETYFRERQARGDLAAFDAWLAASPDVPPAGGRCVERLNDWHPREAATAVSRTRLRS